MKPVLPMETYWTVDEVATRLKAHSDSVRRWLCQDQLASVKAGGRTLITESAIQTFISSSTAAAKSKKRRSVA